VAVRQGPWSIVQWLVEVGVAPGVGGLGVQIVGGKQVHSQGSRAKSLMKNVNRPVGVIINRTKRGRRRVSLGTKNMSKRDVTTTVAHVNEQRKKEKWNGGKRLSFRGRGGGRQLGVRTKDGGRSKK